MKFEINIAKKHLYYLIGLVVFVFIIGIAMAQTAANNPGHPAEQIDEGTIAGTLTIAGGNVGIGMTSPGEMLDVNGNIRAKSTGHSSLYIDAGTNKFPQFVFAVNGVNKWNIYSDYANSDILRITNPATAVTVMALQQNGNIGIGTTSPDQALQVIGKARIGGVTSSNTVLIDTNAIDALLNGVSTTFYINHLGTGNVIIDGGGNVGIGTASPAEKLHVTGGNLAIGETSGGTTRALKFFDGTATTFSSIINPSSAGLRFLTNNDNIDAMSILSNGNVGIGTTSPTSGVKLEVVGANSKFQLTDTGFLYGGYNGAGSFSIAPGSWSNGNLILNAAGSGNIILGNSVGSVGIGTSSPSSKLDVRGKVYVYNAGQDAQLMLDSNTNQAILQGPSSRGLGFQLTGASGENSRFFFRNIVGTDLMYIADAGNVGIGTSSPTAALYVQPSSSEDEALKLRPKSGLSGYTLTFLLDDTAAYITHDSALRKLILGANNLNTLTMDASGNVGIGTTSPSVKLQVAGTVKATAFNTGDIVFNKDDKPVWRMFEDEEGLYLESLKTGETYKFLLQKIERK
ncbi:MAG: hypothetical protein Q7J54_08180 [Candidatus Woesearchaeota archaeon]|nr:hypothetical protein [Candidatus Woesearchaeota archaeon]